MAKGRANLNWKDRVIEWQVSGKSVNAWCLENHIPITTFYGWKSRLEKQPINKPSKNFKAKPAFVELKDKEYLEHSNSGIVLEYAEVKIHLNSRFNPLILKQCLDCLRGR